jgi:predicted Co/Zn/Cd cation transporter (cation efflux family)
MEQFFKIGKGKFYLTKQGKDELIDLILIGGHKDKKRKIEDINKFFNMQQFRDYK